MKAIAQMAQGAASGLPPRFILGGHRGVGENLWSQVEGAAPFITPSYRENTIKSFMRASDLGVGFIEFDVQVTSDGVPVIWHDDSLLQQAGGQDAVGTEVKDMPLQRFKAALDAGGAGAGNPPQLVRHFRSVQTGAGPEAKKLLPWVCTADDALPELRELFSSIPERTGFDVEIKMTNGSDVARTPPEEVDRVVDAIWQVVEAHGTPPAGSQGRDIFFSSFDPDVCTAIRQKQAAHQVWFLSGCGLYPHVDARRTSIPAALAFAAEQQLDGVVLPAQVLLANEGAVAEAAARGLCLMTYGLENDRLAAVQRQQELGVYGAIVDNVQSVMGIMGKG